MKKLLTFVTLWITLSQCVMTTLSSETSREVCRQWRASLFLPSHADTIDTARGLNNQYKVQETVCGFVVVKT